MSATFQAPRFRAPALASATRVDDPPPVGASGTGAFETGAFEDKRPEVPAHTMPHRTPVELLALARRGLMEAAGITSDGQRYATAHLAALRAAAAVLVARARPVPGRRGRPTSVWSLLAMVAPELSDWAAFFAAGATKRAAAEAGIPRVVSAQQANDLLRDAERFLGVTENALGFAHQPMLGDLAS